MMTEGEVDKSILTYGNCSKIDCINCFYRHSINTVDGLEDKRCMLFKSVDDQFRGIRKYDLVLKKLKDKLEEIIQ